MARNYNVTVIGATGMVGEEFLKILPGRQFPLGRLRLVASPRSAGKKIQFDGREIEVGRQEGQGLRLVGEGVSRKHCRLVRDEVGPPSRWRIIDDDSTTGVFIGARQIAERVLAPLFGVPLAQEFKATATYRELGNIEGWQEYLGLSAKVWMQSRIFRSSKIRFRRRTSPAIAHCERS